MRHDELWVPLLSNRFILIASFKPSHYECLPLLSCPLLSSPFISRAKEKRRRREGEE